MATPSSWHLYLLSAAIAPTCLLVTAPEDSVEFFLLQGFIWGVVTFFFYHARRVSWISNGLPDGPLAVQPWQDAAPCWCYEAAFWTQILTYVPSLLRMLFFTCRSREAFITSSTLFLSEHTESVWFERMLFAQLFGYMMRDMFMQGFSADPLLAMHHLLVIVLTLALGFYDIPGGRMCATLGCVIELGTAGYCHFIVWRIPSLYRYLMNISNVVWVVGVTCIVYLAKERSKVLWGCCAITVALVVGRTDMMRVEIRKEAKRIKRGDDLAHAHEVRTAQYPSTQCSFSRRRLKRTLAQISSLSPAHAARPLPMASAARPCRPLSESPCLPFAAPGGALECRLPTPCRSPMRPPLALVTSRALRPQDGSPATTPSTLWPPTPSPSMRTACDPARWMTPAPEEAPAGSLAAAAPCVYTPFGHGPLCHQALCLQPVPVPQALLVAAPADPYSRQQAGRRYTKPAIQIRIWSDQI
ncbi:unnamed protein product [Prorocentrum cordatum]|uniref:TLC domain-containing protein n=1 Tax=Prorocentrum cordatum TaxID=2364126 RepID=A0ABN9PPX4_9DINO|nr:unnamed protein product [Polarella glacialis]